MLLLQSLLSATWGKSLGMVPFISWFTSRRCFFSFVLRIITQSSLQVLLPEEVKSSVIYIMIFLQKKLCLYPKCYFCSLSFKCHLGKVIRSSLTYLLVNFQKRFFLLFKDYFLIFTSSVTSRRREA